MGYEPEIRSSHPKPPTRIEKLGELYDEAVERVAARQRIAHIEDQVVLNSEDRAHSWDMQVIQTYLEQTKRPEREPETPEWPEWDVQGLIESVQEVVALFKKELEYDNGFQMDGREKD